MKSIRLEIEAGIASITLDDGKVNALSAEMIGEIGEAIVGWRAVE